MSTTRMAEAVDCYHELLSGEFRDSTVQIMSAALEQDRLKVAGRPVCNVLRPFFVDQNTYLYVRQAALTVMNAVRIVAKHMMTDHSLLREFDLSPEEEEILRIDTGFGAHDLSARLDGFLGPNGEFQFVEYNADSPGGIAFGDLISESFRSLPLMKELAKRFPWYTHPVRMYVHDALLAAYHRWGGRSLPNIAILDWHDVGTFNEFLILQAYFESKGCRSVVVDPAELEFRDGKVWAGDFRVDLIYKRLVVGDIIAKLGMRHPLVEAVRNKAVCMANGFRVQVLFKKMLFAILSDPAYSEFFPKENLQALAVHIPWTRKVRECKTTFHNESVDLLPFIEQNRERLVLKPNSEYGGRGVILGWECEPEHWKEALQNALSASYVVQERVVVGRETYPSYVDGELRFDERYFDLDPYVWEGERAEGCGVRLSKAAVVNVAIGGSATPMFVIS